MIVSVILAHPNSQSFNHAIARTAADELSRNGHEVRFHDLCAEKFDPILSSAEIPDTAVVPNIIETHCREVASADGIVIVHPNWWGQPPAILKGWIDRVLRPGVAYNFLEGNAGEGIPIGLLKAKVAIVFNTSNTPEEREQEVFGDPLELIWRQCIFDLCGVNNFCREMFRVVVTSTQSERAEWLEKVKKTINIYFPQELYVDA
ncbi:MAG: NAD(P)H-dependent oxidoreductase [Deltaproteobacteria bacterium]|nr:NAD(P)H-dependent oxidoreductase [Deltaproteobacteria bacterium]